MPEAHALLAVFALSSGAYMSVVRGDEELEEDIRRMHRLRTELPDLRLGAVDYAAVVVDHEAVHPVGRRLGRDYSVLLVNLSDQPLEAVCSLDAARLRWVTTRTDSASAE